MEFNQAENKDEKTMLRDFIRQEIGEHFQQQAMVSSGSDSFYKQQSYLSSLIEVASRTDHKLHDEIDEAVKRLKELTYA